MNEENVKTFIILPALQKSGWWVSTAPFTNSVGFHRTAKVAHRYAVTRVQHITA